MTRKQRDNMIKVFAVIAILGMIISSIISMMSFF